MGKDSKLSRNKAKCLESDIAPGVALDRNENPSLIPIFPIGNLVVLKHLIGTPSITHRFRVVLSLTLKLL